MIGVVLKVLMVDKYYFVKGGAERYFFELKEILESKGHSVIPFSMEHPRNVHSPYSRYFVDYIDFNPSSWKERFKTGIRSVGRILYSLQARNRLNRLIQESKPDIAHLHMIDHQISPSILPVLKGAGIPVVQTVHTYKHVCPSYRLYHMDKGSICEKCMGGDYYHAMFERCHKGSFFASLILVLEMYLHKWLQLYSRYVDLFLVPSRFMGDKLVEGGIDPGRVRRLFYTIKLEDYPYRFDSDGYFLYYGRLSGEKGVLTLLEAMKGVSRSFLKIVGEGPQRQVLQEFAQQEGIEGVEFLGPMEGDALKSVVSGAEFVVVPSEWYENSPLVVYESFAMGKPVIGSRIGGIPELIEHGVDGYLFEAGNSDELRYWISYLLRHKELLRKLGRAARKKAEKIFDPHFHYEEIMKVYSPLLMSTNELFS